MGLIKLEFLKLRVVNRSSAHSSNECKRTRKVASIEAILEADSRQFNTVSYVFIF